MEAAARSKQGAQCCRVNIYDTQRQTGNQIWRLFVTLVDDRLRTCLSRTGQLREHLRQLVLKQRLAHRPSRPDYHIKPTQICLGRAETLSDASLEPIAPRAPSIITTTHNHTQTRCPTLVEGCRNLQRTLLYSQCRFSQYGQNVSPSSQASTSGKGKAWRRHLASSLRPLRRRALKILRPPLVLMRALKPCRRLRRMTLG